MTAWLPLHSYCSWLTFNIFTINLHPFTIFLWYSFGQSIHLISLPCILWIYFNLQYQFFIVVGEGGNWPSSTNLPITHYVGPLHVSGVQIITRQSISVLGWNRVVNFLHVVRVPLSLIHNQPCTNDRMALDSHIWAFYSIYESFFLALKWCFIYQNWSRHAEILQLKMDWKVFLFSSVFSKFFLSTS